MEYISSNKPKIRIKDILLDKQNWLRFFFKYQGQIRVDIVLNVLKVIMCGTLFLGFLQYACGNCDYTKKVYCTCKSKFCTSCGKKATDQWIQKHNVILPETNWQHITFTLPKQLWPLFWLNRFLFNLVPPIAAEIIKELAKNKGAIPGIFLAIHTFGRDLKRNVHFHLSTTCGGLSFDQLRWISLYFNEKPIKTMWRYRIITLLRNLAKKKSLKLPKSLKHLSYTAFNAWLDQIYQKKWVVHLQKQSNDHKRNVNYLGKYLKRPPIAETKIIAYDGKSVSYRFFDHATKVYQIKTLPVLDFIGRLVTHIHDKYFRAIRYYGWLSNRTRTALLPIVCKLINCIIPTQTYVQNWRSMIQSEFGLDPLQCPDCKDPLLLIGYQFPEKIGTLLEQHETIVSSITVTA
jgi:Putative transposase/Transposase zinc-binding domain